MADATPMIELHAVTKQYTGSDAAAVDDLDLTVPRGELVVLVGPSGCGKTTTLKMINRIIEPTAGRITVDGQDTADVVGHELRRRIGYVIQRVGLFPHRTIRQNIATVPSLLGHDNRSIEQRVRELMELMDLDMALLERYPAELSGGQQQRVGVARALAADPPVLLMDEPYGAVDPLVRTRLQEQLRELQSRLHKTIVFVTHDIDEAILLGDRIAIFGPGGRLEQYDTPASLLHSPATSFVESFLGGDRHLRRLSLVRVGDVDLVDGPVVGAAATREAAIAAAQGAGTRWVAVVEDGRLRGWVWLDDIVASTTVADCALEPFEIEIGTNASLRAAIDAIVATRLHVAVVHESGDYRGMLFLDDVNRHLEPR